jgi:hypothetical protein
MNGKTIIIYLTMIKLCQRFLVMLMHESVEATVDIRDGATIDFGIPACIC